MTSAKVYKTICKSLFWLGETNLFIAIAAATATMASFGFYNKPIQYKIVAFIFFATLFTYNFQRRIGDIRHTATFYHAKTILMYVACIGVVVFVFTLKINEVIVLLIAAILSAGYALPFVFIKSERLALRQMPYLKIWIIVAVWVLSTAIVPLLSFLNFKFFNDGLSALFFGLQQGNFILALTIPFDIRDQKQDQNLQHTLPMEMGIRKSRRMAQKAMMAVFVFAFLNYLIGFFAFRQMVVQLVISILGYFVVGYGWKIRSPLYYSIVLDGMIILQGILIVMVSN